MAELLTDDVWALILQHVPQADRLKHCALVCKKLSRAAAAATDALEVSLQWRNSQEHRQQRAEAFDSYLQHHGRHVTSLVLDNDSSQPLAQLPCPQLLQLDISSTEPLQLGPHGGLPGVLDSCTGLTSLKLLHCIVAPDGGLSSLSVLVDLRNLHVLNVRLPGGRYAMLPGSVLPSLKHLTRLDLSDVHGVEAVHHVSRLTNLSVLSIRAILGFQHAVRLARDIAPDFALPASLQQLCLGRGIVLDLDVLAATTQLTRFELEALSVEGPGGGVSRGAALLAAVARLQRLDTLELLELEGVAWPAPGAAYTALTASSKLQKLVVCGCRLPEGVWEHVFPRCSPAMRHFASDDLTYWGVEAASSLVRCCPGLQDLEVPVCGDAGVAALKPLTALTNLLLITDCTHDEAAVGVSARHVAALTNLQQLNLRVLTFDDAGVKQRAFAALPPLTALRQLADCSVVLFSTRTVLNDDEVEVEAEEELVALHFSNKAGPGQPPDVWLQLQKLCSDSNNSQPAVTAVATQLAKQQAEQEQQYAERLAVQEQRLAELREQQVQRLAQLGQQGQLQALQAQLQQIFQSLLPPQEQQEQE